MERPKARPNIQRNTRIHQPSLRPFASPTPSQHCNTNVLPSLPYTLLRLPRRQPRRRLRPHGPPRRRPPLPRPPRLAAPPSALLRPPRPDLYARLPALCHVGVPRAVWLSEVAIHLLDTPLLGHSQGLLHGTINVALSILAMSLGGCQQAAAASSIASSI